MNRERINLWVAKTVPMMIEIGKTIGAPPFPGRDAEIEQIDAWLDVVAIWLNARISDRVTMAADVEALESYNFFSDGSGRSEAAATPIDGVWLARSAVIRVVSPEDHA